MSRCFTAVFVMVLGFVAACGDTDDAGSTGQTGTCESTCETSIALGCPSGEHDQTNCVASCAAQQATCESSGYASIFQAYLDCIESNPMTCGSTTQTPTSEACVNEGLATLACSAGGSSLDGCPSLAASPNMISETQMGSSYPTPAGGAIQDGTYYLSRFEVYAPATADEHVRNNRIDLKGGRMVVQTQNDSGAPTIMGGTATPNGTNLDVEIDCPSSSSASIPFTASGTELWIFDPSEPNVQVYTRQ